MKQYSTTITRGGQITLPAEIRRLLAVDSGDRVTFEVEGTEVRISPAKWTLQTLTGSVKPPRKGLDVDDAIRQANEEMAAKVIRQIKGE